MIVYASRQLKSHEVNYPTHDLEMWTRVLAFNIYTHYLKYLMDHPSMNIRKQRWLDVVKEYDCVIWYHYGKANVVANALSHMVVCSPI